MRNNITGIKKGDIFSESSHYIFEHFEGNNSVFKHKESGTTVSLGVSYVQNLLTSADQFDTTLEVGKEDKLNGELGIRSIWQNIHSKDVFTVCFRKQDKDLSAKKIKDAINLIEAAQKNKKGVAAIAKMVVEKVQNNPILPYEPGESRILRGYKIQFESRDGKYNCVDMDLLTDLSTEDDKAIRPVNINSIEWLIYHGVKYIVK